MAVVVVTYFKLSGISTISVDKAAIRGITSSTANARYIVMKGENI